METNREAIEAVIRSLGVYGRTLYTQQLISAVELAYEDPQRLLYVTKELYPAVASRYKGANWNTVERNLRQARDQVWEKGNVERLSQMAGFPLKQRPTTGEFIDIIYYYMTSHRLFPNG